MLENVTMLIATSEGRRDKIKRALSYYSGTGLNIIVADTAKADLNVSRYEKNVKYLNYQNYDYYKDYIKKIMNMVELTETDYCLLGADDDFTIPSTIKSAKDFLGDNENYVVARGQEISFQYNEKNIAYNYYTQYKEWESGSDNLERFKNSLMIEGFGCFYGLYKTNALKEILSYTNKIENIALLESFLDYGIPLLGEIRNLDMLYMVREHATNSGAFTVPNGYNFIYEERYKLELERFYKGFALLLKDKTILNLEESYEMIKRIFTQKLSQNNNSYESKGVRFLSKIIPRKVKNLFSTKIKHQIVNCIEKKYTFNLEELRKQNAAELKRIETEVFNEKI